MPSNNVFQYNKIRTRNEVRRKALKPEKKWNPALFGIRNPVPGIRNPQHGIQNPRLSWIPLHGAISDSQAYTLFKTFDTKFIYKERFAWNPAKNRVNFIFGIIFITFSFLLTFLQNSNPQLTGSKPSMWVEITLTCMDRKSLFISLFTYLFINL